MKKILISTALICASLMAAPSQYSVKKLAPSLTITVDGYIDEWNESYFIDSLKSDDNVYARSTALPEWSPDQYQYKLYLAYTSRPTQDGTDTGYVYGAARVVRDKFVYIRTTQSGAYAADNMKINPGGQAQAFYISTDGGAPVLNPSSPYVTNRTVFARCRPRSRNTGADTLPTYEWAMRLDVTDPFGMGGITGWQASFGSEDWQSAGSTAIFCAVGAEYTGYKQAWSSNPWDQAIYYPTFIQSSDTGTAAEVSVLKAGAVASLSASPNPFLPATTLSYTANSNGVIKIYDAAGKLVKSETVNAGSGKVAFNASRLASGVYVARLEAGKAVVNTKLFLTR